MEDFKIGIRFSPVSGSQTAGTEKIIKTSHWSLVFTSSTRPNWSLHTELITDTSGAISFPTKEEPFAMESYPLATFRGSDEDVRLMISIHPVNTPELKYRYDAVFNNCQHWAATLLVFLQAFCASSPGKSFTIIELSRWNKVMSVLSRQGDSKFHHSSNWLFKTASALGGGMGVGAAGAAIGAMTAVTQVSVPAVVAAPGVLGWLGFTTMGVETVAVVGVGAGAVVGAVLLPSLLAGTVMGGAYVVSEHAEWKKRTLFDDPRVCGVPWMANIRES